ncbi:alpha/beta hydrolase [Allokutzneria sp. A3M-2-11 16]|uniref:alpha/beta fold hydrolase n=1 Tax=Allokutzneria sp. A3M-2-11 16 TaxID=2962043 RepID=UPI0020B6429D|nr:alpha/beta hydrolase [Allokutzneria sp. A3M-2-11 16]MCP3799045.1 alpha/beta hydrolase [Allokutzneria sp. A3M-2-11 16]
MTWHAHGSGDPVTVVVPGLGTTPGEARLPASGLPGTRVVLTLPGHGDAADAPPGYWCYDRVADDVASVADEVGATAAIGTSVGAAALINLVARKPERFERLALLLPATLTESRGDPNLPLLRMSAAVARGDRAEMRELMLEQLPDGIAPGYYVETRVSALMRLGDALAALPGQAPLSDPAQVAGVHADVLVIAATGDDQHPQEVAEAVAAAFPHGRLEVLPTRAPLLTHRPRVRELLTEWLARPSRG